MPAREFVRHWTAFGFQADPPNAALTLLGGADDAETVVVELVRPPRYDRERHTMRYVVRLLKMASGRLNDFQDDLDAYVPRRFGAASLFIDRRPGLLASRPHWPMRLCSIAALLAIAGASNSL